MSQTLFDGLSVQALVAHDPAKTGLRCSVFLSTDELLPAVRRLYQKTYSLEDLTAIDVAEGYLLVYHFIDMEQPGRIALRVLVPHDEATLPSIAAVFQGAEWHERETTDFYGITFEGNPNPVPLLLMPENRSLHPLRKEDGERARLAQLSLTGEIVRQAPDFALLTPKEPTPEA